MDLYDNNTFAQYYDTYENLAKVEYQLHTYEVKRKMQESLLENLLHDKDRKVLESEKMSLRKEIEWYENHFVTIWIDFFVDYKRIEVASILESIDQGKLITREFDKYRKKIKIIDSSAFTSRVMNIYDDESDKITFLSVNFWRLIEYIYHDYDIVWFDDRFLDIYNMLIKIQPKVFSLKISESNKIAIEWLYTLCNLQRKWKLLSYMKWYKDWFLPMKNLDVTALSADINNQFGSKASELQTAISHAITDIQKNECTNEIMTIYELLYNLLWLEIVKESIDYFFSYILDFIEFCEDKRFVKELYTKLKQKYNSI